MSVQDSLPPDLAWRMPPLPPAREFVTSAGFAGAGALIAAVIVALAVMFAVWRTSKRHDIQHEQRERHHRELRYDERHAAAIARCWQRLVWVVETAGIEPAANEGTALGLGPELALEILRGLLNDAEELEEDALAKAATAHLEQLALVLRQQAGPLTEVATTPAATDEKPSATTAKHSSTTPAKPDEQPTKEVPKDPASPATDKRPATGRKVSVGGRRRQQ